MQITITTTNEFMQIKVNGIKCYDPTQINDKALMQKLKRGMQTLQLHKFNAPIVSVYLAEAIKRKLINA